MGEPLRTKVLGLYTIISNLVYYRLLGIIKMSSIEK